MAMIEKQLTISEFADELFKGLGRACTPAALKKFNARLKKEWQSVKKSRINKQLKIK